MPVTCIFEFSTKKSVCTLQYFKRLPCDTHKAMVSVNKQSVMTYTRRTRYLFDGVRVPMYIVMCESRHLEPIYTNKLSLLV